MEQKQIDEFQAKQPSLRVRLRDMFKTDEVPEDLGLFPGTLIMPVGPEVPPIYSWSRWKMQLQRMVKKGRDLATVLYMKWSMGFFKYQLQRRKIMPTAMALHRQVYAAVADGDEAEIRKVTTEGVRNKLIMQIQGRPESTVYEWDLVKYVGRPKIVSHIANQMPIPKNDDKEQNLMRQAVVRIQSVQRLTKEEDFLGKERTLEPVHGQVAEKEVIEYIVIQKRVLQSVEEPWKFWGTTQPTTMEHWAETINPPQDAQNAAS
ncbi:MAG: hypothetical protein Q9162_003870 [Coniocarpon cinnabarinum]